MREAGPKHRAGIRDGTIVIRAAVAEASLG